MSEQIDFAPGIRVQTPFGQGAVAYVRMAPPDYATVAAVSVKLDGRELDHNYTGTILPVEQVTIIPFPR